MGEKGLDWVDGRSHINGQAAAVFFGEVNGQERHGIIKMYDMQKLVFQSPPAIQFTGFHWLWMILKDSLPTWRRGPCPFPYTMTLEGYAWPS